jgi:hypothetical protein
MDETLRAALVVFADLADWYDSKTPDEYHIFGVGPNSHGERIDLTLGDFRRARQALARPPAPDAGARVSCAHFEAVKWNPYNGVVQCRHCGHVYVPVAAPPGEPYRRAWEAVYGESPLPRDTALDGDADARGESGAGGAAGDAAFWREQVEYLLQQCRPCDGMGTIGGTRNLPCYICADVRREIAALAAEPAPPRPGGEAEG